MNGSFKRSIRHELFGILLLVLALHSVILLVMGSRLFQHFYLSSRSAELKNAARRIQKTCQQAPEELFEVVDEVEDRNAIVTLFTLSDEEPVIEYYTRFRDPPAQRRGLRREEPPFPQFFEKMGEELRRLDMPQLREELQRLAGEKSGLLVLQENGGFGGGRIRVLCALEEGRYLQVETPLEYIHSVAAEAVRYTAYLSVIILLAGGLGIYLLSGRITRPIRHMQDVADKIAHLDFSESCQVRPGNELGALGESINNMAARLQEDIRQLVAANAVLQSDLVRQQQDDQMRRRFIADVSHDFKTPLALIISYAEALEGEQDERVRREYTAIITEEGNKLSRMVGSLLRLSQLECGMQKLEPALFCLDELLLGVMASHRIMAQKRGLQVSAQIESGLIVQADYQKVEQAAVNLYENAVKYAVQGGRIQVGAKAQAGRCRVTVDNDGENIPEEELPRLFESFYRADRSRRRDGQSYGLGLAIVKAIIALHGEECGCENLPGGVRFWFTLPLAQIEEDGLDDSGR